MTGPVHCMIRVEADFGISFTSFCFVADRLLCASNFRVGKLRKLRLAGSLCNDHADLTTVLHQSPSLLHLACQKISEHCFTLRFELSDPCVHLEFHAKYASCIYLSVQWLISGLYNSILYFIPESYSCTIIFLVVTSGRVMALVISESDQNKKACIHNAFNIFQKTSVHWFPSEFGIGGWALATPASLQEPDLFQLKLTKCHQAPIVQAMASSLKRLSHLCHLSLFALISWAAGSTSAQPLCHHALSKRQTKFWIVQLQYVSYKSYSSDFGGFINSSKQQWNLA